MDKTEQEENLPGRCLPTNLEIFNEITRLREEGRSLKEHFRDYGVLYFIAVLYCIGAWVFFAFARGDYMSASLFFATIFLVLMFHFIAEKRLRRRMEILAEILEKLKCDEK